MDKKLNYADVNGITNHTASYVFTRERGMGTIYFGAVRKVPANSRLGFRTGRLTGAAGTKPKYHGKWTNIGGGVKGQIPSLRAAIDELNSEAYVGGVANEFDSKSDVGTTTSQHRLILHSAYKIGSVDVYLLEVRNPDNFFQIFPKFSDIARSGRARVGKKIVDSSHGEIDAVASFNMTEIMELQDEEKIRCNNNFFINYFCKTLNLLLHHRVFQRISRTFDNNWHSQKIKCVDDQLPRTPSELKNHDYTGKGPQVRPRAQAQAQPHAQAQPQAQAQAHQGTPRLSPFERSRQQGMPQPQQETHQSSPFERSRQQRMPQPQQETHQSSPFERSRQQRMPQPQQGTHQSSPFERSRQ